MISLILFGCIVYNIIQILIDRSNDKASKEEYY